MEKRKDREEKHAGTLMKIGAGLFGSGFAANVLRQAAIDETDEESLKSDPILAISARAALAGMGLMFLQILVDFLEFLGEKYSEKEKS